MITGEVRSAWAELRATNEYFLEKITIEINFDHSDFLNKILILRPELAITPLMLIPFHFALQGTLSVSLQG